MSTPNPAMTTETPQPPAVPEAKFMRESDTVTPSANAAWAMEKAERVAELERELAAANAKLAEVTKIAAEGRLAGRQEALAIILESDAEDPFDAARVSYPIGDTGDYGLKWVTVESSMVRARCHRQQLST